MDVRQHATTSFDTKRAGERPDAIAPDGSEVRLLCATARGSMAQFRLPAGAVARAVAHRTVEEIWYVVRGRGRIWLKQGDAEDIVALAAGTSLAIPAGVGFQFRNDGGEPLDILGLTMPPWPGEGEAVLVEGKWPPAV